jgi:hypothetical protein
VARIEELAAIEAEEDAGPATDGASPHRDR